MGAEETLKRLLSSGTLAIVRLQDSAKAPKVVEALLKGGVDCKWYVQQLNRVMTGEIDKERAIPVDEAEVEAVRSAPTVCTTCGATLPALARGVTELTCEYCGTVVRV